MTEIELRQQIAGAANSFLEVPYGHQRRSRAMVDCIGLVVCVGSELGIMKWDEKSEAVKPFLNYSYTSDMQLMKKGLETFLHQIIPKENATIGDILWIRSPRPQHLGIITRLNPMVMVHAQRTAGKVVEHRITSKVKNHIVAAWRYPGLQEIAGE